MNKWILLVGLVVIVGLFGGLHHVVVHTAKGSAFSNAFAGTCQWCHGEAYQSFGQGEDG